MNLFQKAHERMIQWSAKWHVPVPSYDEIKARELEQQSPDTEWKREEREVFQGDTHMAGESPEKPRIWLVKASDSPDIFTEEKSNRPLYPDE